MQFVQSVVNQQTTANNSNDVQPTNAQFVGQIQLDPSTARLPYGAGDTDDGYTLVFPNLDAFVEWRKHEEETKVVEFVKGDTHGSKAVPPRFKDHTKLVCARHSRSGRKKYIKKHPERVRKVQSRKLEGQGCSASISYKTYFDTDEVRACYNSEHSHEIGPANLPFTKRGRKGISQEGKKARTTTNATQDTAGSTASSSQPVPGNSANAVATSTTSNFSSSISMLAPIPNVSSSSQPTPNPYVHQHYPPQHAQAHPYTVPPPPDHRNPVAISVAQERWERMTVLYHSIREHARGFEYPSPSVAALESILIRLYLESPVGTGSPLTISISSPNGSAMPAPVTQRQPIQSGLSAAEGSKNRVGDTSENSETIS